MLFPNGPTSWNVRWSSIVCLLHPPVRALQQQRIILHARALAHHPAAHAQVLERAQQLAPAELRLAERLVPAFSPGTVLDARDVHVQPVERRPAEPRLDRRERRGEVLVTVVPAEIARIAMREVDAG